MNDFDQMQPRDAFFSKRIRAGKRTYYFDVKATRGNDYYITITESKRKPGESEDRPFFEKHKLFLYKEDFEKFTEGLHEALDYIREKRANDPAPAPMVNVQTAEMQENASPEMHSTEMHETAEPVQNSFTNINFEDLNK